VSDDTTPIYFRVSPAIWRARTWTDDMRLLACYLLTSPHRTLEGLFILPKGYCCADLQWSPERLAEPFAGLTADGFIAYDETAEVCLIVKALKYQRPENPNMDKAAIRRLVTVPASSLDTVFLASAQQYAPRLAERLAERLPERFGKSQLCSSSTQLNPALRAPAREDPVDKSDNTVQNVKTEQGRSIDLEEEPVVAPAPSPPAAAEAPSEGEPVTDETCDGRPCTVHEFPSSAFGPLRRSIAASKQPEQWKQVGTGGELDKLLGEYAGHVCAACQAAFGEHERPQLDGLCERALIAAVESLKGSHDVAKVMRSRLARFGLDKLIDDRTFEELRRTKRDKRRKGEPRRIREALPAFAQPQGPAKGCEPGEALQASSMAVSAP
jgi:hypothetical protein